MKIIFTITIGLASMIPFVASAGDIGGIDGYSIIDYGRGFMLMAGAVWLAVGVLAIIWLWQQINKKDCKHH